MSQQFKKHKRRQRCGVYELDPDEMVDIPEPLTRRSKHRKFYPMDVKHNSLEEETYLEVAPKIQGLEPSKLRMTILTSEDSTEWDQDDDDI
jgi:hypothetical protein